MSEYRGPALCNPHGKKVGEFTGRLSDQSQTIQDAIHHVRQQTPIGDPNRVAFPHTVQLTMNDGTIISGWSQGEAFAFHPGTGLVRPIICRWDGPVFRWAIIEFQDETITASVHENPPEKGQEFRKKNPMITRPSAA